MSKIFKIIFNALLIFIILLLVSYFALRITDKIKIYNVETGSMEDKIHTGDYILLCKKNNYYVGDVVTYQVDGYFVTHRIITIDGNKIITKGDANNKEDEEINMNQVVGKVIYCGGLLNIIIKYKFALVAALIALYLLSCCFDKEETKDDLKEDESDAENIEEAEDTKEEIIVEKEENDGLETMAIDDAECKEDETISEERKEEIIEEKIEEKELQKPSAKRTKKKENVEIKEDIKETKVTKTTKKNTKKDK